MKPDPQLPPAPFPLEAIYPGTHEKYPAIAAAEAESFLAHGSGPTGFALTDPEIIRWLTGADPWPCDFQIAPVPPEWTALLAPLPEWHHPMADAIAPRLREDLARRIPGLLPGVTLAILEHMEVWACLN